MTPEQILQFKAIIEQMQRSKGGITGAAARRWNAVGGLANRVGSYISGRRQAEINKAAEIEKERIRAAEAGRRAQYIDTSPYRERGRTQPGTQRSSKRFQGHSRRGRGGGFIFGEDILGSKRDWHRRRFPRKRNLSEVYTQGPGILA
jgi:hypothetical protein